MASILDRYGIKEVADVTFYKIDENGKPSTPVLYLDTLKVSTIEQTAETADARGGKGNPKLITWDYGKEITVSIEDALFSPKSMNIMFGKEGASLAKTAQQIEKVTAVRIDDKGKLPGFITVEAYDKINGSTKKKISMDGNASTDEIVYANSGITLVGVYLEDGTDLNVTAATSEGWGGFTQEDHAGKKAYVKYTVAATASTITINGDSFPGTYYVTGDTYARSDVDGKDQFFQFIIPKA